MTGAHAARAALPGATAPGRRAFVLGLAGAALLPCTPVLAQAGAGLALERKVKAGFLVQFLGYAEFPAAALGEAGAPLVIGVIDADDLAVELARIVTGRSIGARSIMVKVLRELETLSGVHVLFVGGADPVRVGQVLRAVAPAPVLLVTEAEEGLRQGSVINFRIVDERVRFDVSLGAAEKNRIKLSSRLLTVANLVFKAAP